MAYRDFQPRLPWDNPIGESSLGSAESAYQSKYGTAPYDELRRKAQSRFSLMNLLAGGLTGLAAGPGGNFGYSLGRGFGLSYGRSQAASRAAQEYAMKAAEQQASEEDKALNRKYKEAIIDNMAKPAPPEKPAPPQKLSKAQEAEATLGRPLTDVEKQIIAGVYREPKVAKVPAGAKPKAAGPEKPATGAERQTLAYYNRAKEAEDAISTIETKISKLDPIQQIRLSRAPNWAQSPDQQVYRQAQRAFTEARLRKESGAAIPQGEYDTDARTYFAQPGDSQAVMERKRKARLVVLNGLKFGAGKAYKEFYGDSGSSGGGATLRWNPQTQELEPIR